METKISGLEKVEKTAKDLVDGLVLQYKQGLLNIERDYQARRAVVEGARDIAILERSNYRRLVDGLYKAELQSLKGSMQGLLTSTMQLIDKLEDPFVRHELVMDLRQIDRAAVLRAELFIKSLKNVVECQN